MESSWLRSRQLPRQDNRPIKSGARGRLQSNNNAAGAIHVGPTEYLCDEETCYLPDITYDGCIEIWDDGEGGYGDLDGDVTVVGCHALDPPYTDLALTIEGDQNGGVIIVQTGCENQVGWGDCP